MNNNSLIAWYPFDAENDLGKDKSDNGYNAEILGTDKPEYAVIEDRAAVLLKGGNNGSSYIKLPFSVLDKISENTGLSISAWVYGKQCKNGWERIFDFGANERGPYLFMNRFFRAVAFSAEDIAADAGKAMPENEWTHFTYTISPSKNGTESLAGPRLYVNGELVADGIISQTSSGRYKAFRNWESFFYAMDESAGLYIGRSQFPVDPDFNGAVSDFRIYNRPLTESEVLAEICNSLSAEEVLKMARDRFLPIIPHIIPLDIKLPFSLMDGKVSIEWDSDLDVIAEDGTLKSVSEVLALNLTARLSYNGACLEKSFKCTLLPEGVVCSEFDIKDEKICDISETLYGLFFEDINHSADGGIYAEMIQNRSFEEFVFDTYDARSGENGTSTGRVHNPLKYWFGDLENVEPMYEGGINEQFGLDKDTNSTYIKVSKDTCLINRGFCDDMMRPSMKFVKDESYEFTLWMKSEKDVDVQVCLLTGDENVVSETVTCKIQASSQWKKSEPVILTANSDTLGQIIISFSEEACVDMISLMPVNTWGSDANTDSATAVSNYKGNSNYRLRRDLVDTLRELNPAFLRFPGGCISEGSYIWDNVYDWKDSVGPVELRKENFNVWGYTMTMGLGYMEYFQLAEDLNATPLPVMACGVLCQARSDYANPAGGSLREKYIKNFTDLIDFAISTDFENNKWARIRRDNGHEAPFDLHYLGVGNENWGTEFMANFEIFYDRITSYMKENYPDYNLQIISTVGAQADDDSYQNGWNFLAGGQKGTETIAFTDGEKSFDEEVTWYKNKSNYLNTIADEHYYRSNEYMFENADRYNYYYRPSDKMTVVKGDISKVFVGEYASVDKNTMAGAVAEAAVMTGFEKNSDIVRMAAYAPLFNKITDDGNYRWTPDLIWFDNESVWRTPNYYVQQMFASNIGKYALKTGYKTYINGEKCEITPKGDVVIFTKGKIEIQDVIITGADETVIFEAKALENCDSSKLRKFNGGYYISLDENENNNYTVKVSAKCLEKDACYSVATGVCYADFDGDEFIRDSVSMHEFVVGDAEIGSGLKVYKNGVEGYTLGDYASSSMAGNLRSYFDGALTSGDSYEACVEFKAETISGNAIDATTGTILAEFDNKLDIYNRDIYCSVTRDDSKVYIKLVNPNNTDKNTKISLGKLAVTGGMITTLMASDENTLHTPNVNRRDDEVVKPVTAIIEIGSGDNQEKYVEELVKANSVNVITLNL